MCDPPKVSGFNGTRLEKASENLRKVQGHMRRGADSDLPLRLEHLRRETWFAPSDQRIDLSRKEELAVVGPKVER